VADHLAERTDTAALVVGPTGVALSGDTLYISDSVNNRILAVPDAFERDDPSRGRVVSTGNHLVDPLGMTVSRNGDIITVNGGDGNAVETTPGGAQIATATLDTNNGGGGNLFGVALTPDGRGIYFVDDAPNVNALFVAHQP
jgi:sugar lactone lactonase YvrE